MTKEQIGISSLVTLLFGLASYADGGVFVKQEIAVAILILSAILGLLFLSLIFIKKFLTR